MGFSILTLGEIEGSSLGLYPNKLKNKKTDTAIIRIPKISKRRSEAIFPTFEIWNHNYQVYTKNINYKK